MLTQLATLPLLAETWRPLRVSPSSHAAAAYATIAAAAATARAAATASPTGGSVREVHSARLPEPVLPLLVRHLAVRSAAVPGHDHWCVLSVVADAGDLNAELVFCFSQRASRWLRPRTRARRSLPSTATRSRSTTAAASCSLRTRASASSSDAPRSASSLASRLCARACYLILRSRLAVVQNVTVYPFPYNASYEVWCLLVLFPLSADPPLPAFAVVLDRSRSCRSRYISRCVPSAVLCVRDGSALTSSVARSDRRRTTRSRQLRPRSPLPPTKA